MAEGLAGVYNKLKYGGNKGYTPSGDINWSYRGKGGPELTGGIGSDWTTQQWSDFGAKGGSLDSSGNMVTGGTWNTDAAGNSTTLVPGTGTVMGNSDYSAPSSAGAGNALGAVGAFGSALTGLGGLASAYTGYKNYQLAKDQFDYEKALGNTNLYNQGTLANSQIQNATEVGQSLAGDTMNADQRTAGLAAAKNRFVKTAIG